MAVTCEKYGNNAITNLPGQISASQTSFNVNNAAKFPDAPFRIRIEDEYMLVNGKSGNTFTSVTRGVEGSAAAVHAAGRKVGNILTTAGLLNLLNCYSDIGTRSDLPGFDADLEGRLFFITDPAWYIFRDLGTGWESYGPVFEMTEPNETGFSWVNQGSATTSTTDGGVYLTTPAPGGAGENVRIRVESNAASVTVTAAFIPLLPPLDETSCGLIFRESSTGEFIFFRLLFNTASSITKNDLVISLDKYDSATALNSNYKIASAAHLKSSVVWLRMVDDVPGTTLTWSISNDGENFHTFDTQTRTDFLASGPNQVGFAANSTNTSATSAMTLLSWEKS